MGRVSGGGYPRALVATAAMELKSSGSSWPLVIVRPCSTPKHFSGESGPKVFQLLPGFSLEAVHSIKLRGGAEGRSHSPDAIKVMITKKNCSAFKVFRQLAQSLCFLRREQRPQDPSKTNGRKAQRPEILAFCPSRQDRDTDVS